MSDPGRLGGNTSAAGQLAQMNTFLQLFKRLVVAQEALSDDENIFTQIPWAAAGDLDMSVSFPAASMGTIIIDQATPAALNVTLNGPGPWFVVDGGGHAAADNITVQGPGGTTIKGAGTYVISTNWASALFLLYGTNYLVLANA